LTAFYAFNRPRNSPQHQVGISNWRSDLPFCSTLFFSNLGHLLRIQLPNGIHIPEEVFVCIIVDLQERVLADMGRRLVGLFVVNVDREKPVRLD
jgi:hypothetical protein